MTVHTQISEINRKEWGTLVEQSHTASFFQTGECYDFYASLSFLKPFVFGVSENDKLTGLLCGYIIADGNPIMQYFSKRAIAPGGLLLDKNISSKALKMLLDKAAGELQNKAIYIEIRNYNDYSVFQSSIESVGFSYQPHLNIQVDTSNADAIFSQLNESKRRQIKMAIKAGVFWLESTDTADIKDFYNCLSHLYKSKVKTPLFPLEFFEKLVKIPNGKLLVVKYNGKTIGGMACVVFAGNVLYEWFVCGDDRLLKELYPSVAATYAGIEYAAKNNISRFDFMGAGKPGSNYGVRNFKSKFGGELVENGRFLYLCNPFLYFIGKKIISTYKSISRNS
jgi:lipid II:glycine glycyltransferase (peptidoglycan interpeptide bridge formation enzyme)